jgi:hypothetical protein
MAAKIRSKRYAFMSFLFITQAISSLFVFCRLFSRKNASAFILITMGIYNFILASFCAWFFVSENRPRKRFAPSVSYKDAADSDILDYDIDALSDEELDDILG